MCVITATAGIGAAWAGSSLAATTYAVNWAALGAVASLASTAVSAVGQFQQAQAASKQASYQAAVMRNNALAASYEADYARDKARDDARKKGEETSMILGQQRAAMGASGVVVDEGTFLDVNLETVEQGKLDELAILHEGDKRAYNAELQGMGYTAQSEMYGSRGSSGFLPAGATLIGGVGSTVMSYNQAVR